jgi:hypothetical protein
MARRISHRLASDADRLGIRAGPGTAKQATTVPPSVRPKVLAAAMPPWAPPPANALSTDVTLSDADRAFLDYVVDVAIELYMARREGTK